MSAATGCPAPEQLRGLFEVGVNVAELEALESHLHQCSRCMEAAKKLEAGDTLLQALAETATLPVECRPSEPRVRELVQRLKMLQPSATAGEDQGELTAVGRWTFLAPGQQPNEIGRLGPYRILAVLGQGGMGVVFGAEDPHLQRPVALKAMLPEQVAHPGAKERFVREARAAAALKHPNVVGIYQVGEDQGVPYLAMELLEGRSLEEHLKQAGRLAVPEAVRLGIQVAQGLAAAHAKGLIHRDIKPANIFLEAIPDQGGSAPGTFDPGLAQVKLLDFGLARTMAAPIHLTQSGTLLGTPAYMAPEQARGQQVDARCDLFSLGVVLYRMLTGAMPFKGSDTMSILASLAADIPLEPRLLNPAIPAELNELIVKLLAKDPAQRVQSAQEVAAMLRHLEGHANLERQRPEDTALGDPVALKPAPAPRRWPLAAAGLLLALACAYGAYQLVYATPQGTFLVQVQSKEVEARFKDGALQLLGPDGQVKYTLKPSERNKRLPAGPYKIQVTGADGLTVDVEEFTMKEGDQIAVQVQLKAPPAKEVVVEAKKETTSEPTVAWKPVPLGQSPFDKLDPKAIPESERAPWHPKELVAVIGEQRQRDWISPIALSVRPKGQQVASLGVHDTGAGVWEVPSGRLLWPDLKGGAGRWFHPSGKHFFAGNKVWDLSDPAPTVVGAIPDGPGAYYSSSEGQWVLQWNHDRNRLNLLDCSDPANLRKVAMIPEETVGALAPGAKVLAVAKAGQKVPVRILDWDGQTVKPRFDLPGTGVNIGSARGQLPFCFAPDGRLGVCHADGAFRQWDLRGQEPVVVATIPKMEGQLWPVFSPNGQRLALCWGYTIIFFYQVSETRLERMNDLVIQDQVASNINALAFLPDSKGIVTGHLNGAIRFWDISAKVAKEINPIHPNLLRNFELSSDGKRLVAIAEDGFLRQWSLGEEKPQAAGQKMERAFPSLLAGNSTVALLNEKGYFLNKDRKPFSMPVKGAASRAISSDGRLALIGKNNFLALVQLTDPPERVTDWEEQTSRDPRSEVNIYAIGPEGRHLLRYDGLGNLSLWLHHQKKLTKTSEVRLPLNEREFRGLTFTPDGKTVAVFLHWLPGNVLLFAIVEDRLVPRPELSLKALGTGNTYGGSFSPDGKQLVVYGDRVYVLDYPSGKLAREWRFAGSVQRVLYAPDGRHLLALGANGVLYILRL